MCDCVARDALRRATTAFSHSKQLTRSSHSHAHTLKRRFWDFSATPYIYYIFIGKYVSTCVPSKNLNKNCHENITGTNTMTFPFDNFLFSGPNRRMHWFFFLFHVCTRKSCIKRSRPIFRVVIPLVSDNESYLVGILHRSFFDFLKKPPKIAISSKIDFLRRRN